MKPDDALTLIRDAVPATTGTWADLGAGEGTFTRALARRLGPGSRIFAVDRDARALEKLARDAGTLEADVVTIAVDFTRPFELPGARAGTLDGILLGNALHFVPDPERVLGEIVTWLRPGGRVVLVEYDRRRGSPWVPHPIARADVDAITTAAGLSPATVVATRRSEYGGDLYVAFAERPEHAR